MVCFNRWCIFLSKLIPIIVVGRICYYNSLLMKLLMHTLIQLLKNDEKLLLI